MTLSLRTKTILIWLFTLLALALGLTLATTVTLSLLRNRLVRDAIRLAEEQVAELRDEVRDEILRSGALTTSDLKSLAPIREKVEIFLRHHDEIVSVVILGEDNEVVVKNRLGWGADVEITTDERAHPITAPLVIGDQRLGDLKVMLSESKVLRDIRSTNRMMTTQLLVYVVSMILILGAVFILLWRMFRRHFESIQQQEQMERMAYVGTLASGLAHEIRNPLNAMGLKLQVLEEDLADPRPESSARMGAVANTVRGQIDQLNATLTRFLTFALPRGREARAFDLETLIAEVRDLLQPEIDKRSIDWIEDLRGPAPLKGEPAAFHEVLVNIVLNALYAMEDASPPRQIRVSLNTENNEALLRVADTGPGIAPEDLNRIFEVFFTTREGGSGFGLAIARRIVEDHGGTIEGHNRPEGGAQFDIRVPMTGPALEQPVHNSDDNC